MSALRAILARSKAATSQSVSRTSRCPTLSLWVQVLPSVVWPWALRVRALQLLAFEMGENATPAHLHGQSVSMVGILLENSVRTLDGFLMLLGLIQLDKLSEGGRILAP
jgi:hypothetical protein